MAYSFEPLPDSPLLNFDYSDVAYQGPSEPDKLAEEGKTEQVFFQNLSEIVDLPKEAALFNALLPSITPIEESLPPEQPKPLTEEEKEYFDSFAIVSEEEFNTLKEVSFNELRPMDDNQRLELAVQLIRNGVPTNKEFAMLAKRHHAAGEIYILKFLMENIRIAKQHGKFLLFFKDNFREDLLKNLIVSKINNEGPVGKAYYKYLLLQLKNGKTTALFKAIQEAKDDNFIKLEFNPGLSNALSGFVLAQVYRFLTQSKFKLTDKDLLKTHSNTLKAMWDGVLIEGEDNKTGSALRVWVIDQFSNPHKRKQP